MSEIEDAQFNSPSPAPAPAAAASPRRRALMAIAGVVIVAALAVLVWWLVAGRWSVSTENAYVGAEVAQITPQTGGTVLAVTVSDSSAVKAGDLLVELDPADARIALLSAQADLERARRSVRQLILGQRTLGAQLVARQADAERAGADITRAGADAARASAEAERAGAEAQRAASEVRRLEAEAARLDAVAVQADLALARTLADRDRRAGLETSGAISREERDHADRAVAEAGEAARAAAAAASAARSAVITAREQLAGAGAGARAAREAAAAVATGTRAASAGAVRALADAEAAAAQRDAQGALVAGFTESTHPDVLRAQARVEQAQLDLARTRLTAPFDGVVARRTVQVGQRVAPGAAVMTVVPLDRLYVDANFKENQLRGVRPGQRVQLVSDLYGGGVTFTGRVIGIGGGTGSAFALLPAQNATGNWIKVVQRVPVRIALDPAELAAHPLRVGLSMHATIDLRPPRDPQPAAATAAGPADR